MSPQRVVESAFAAPFFAVGFILAAVAHAAKWCAAAYMTGVDAARKRWVRAG